MVLVKKANGKWRMCVDFTDLNKACPKRLVSTAQHRRVGGQRLGKMLSFLDAFLWVQKEMMSQVAQAM